MANIAIRPKYVTRKAIEKPIFNEEMLLTIIPVESKRQILSLLETSYVALISNNKYYPVNVDTYEAQFDLVKAGSAPTVPEDAQFGFKKLEYFVAASTSAVCAKIQDNVKIYNSIARATLIYVADYATIGDANITKNGYWFVFKFDKTNAATAGYSDIKFVDTKADVVNGDNYIYCGSKSTEVAAKIIAIKAKITVDGVASEVTMTIDHKFALRINFPKDIVNAIEVDGKAFETLKSAFASLPNGGTIVVNKSIEEPNESIIINNGKSYVLTVADNSTITFNKGIEVYCGSLTVNGTGTLTEKTETRSCLILKNEDITKEVNVTVGENITVKGLAALMMTGNSYNLNAVCYGNLFSNTGFGFNVNGSVLSGSFKAVGGSMESVGGVGAYLAGNIDSTISGGTKIVGGESGLEIRAGSLAISGARIESTSTEEPDMKPNGSGSTSVACALAVAQHTTKWPISVNVTGGTFIGKAAFMEGNPQQTESATEDTSIVIAGGTYVGLIKTLTPATDCKKFLKGGTYSANPDASYIADGYKAVANGSSYEIVAK